MMAEGMKLDEAKVKAALEGKRLEFVSLSEVEMPKPVAAYSLKVKGAG